MSFIRIYNIIIKDFHTTKLITFISNQIAFGLTSGSFRKPIVFFVIMIVIMAGEIMAHQDSPANPPAQSIELEDSVGKSKNPSTPENTTVGLAWYFQHQYVIKLALLIVIFSLVISLVVYFNRIQKKREMLKRQILMAEQKAVRSQMNPHFIFNSLNSIQNFILDNDQENANIYLVIFSKLIRRILETTKVNFVSLREEIETIKLYLELEKFRFSTKFEYNIQIDHALNIDHMAIPSMIMQPYLENAIWHGIVPKESHGRLDINFELTDTGILLISITDDGIGRERAAEINKKRKFHKSTGMRNVEERLDLLNQLYRTNTRIEVIDLYDARSQPSGTRIEIYVNV